MLMAYGICAALVERATSGRGQVVDAAIVDGVASLLAMPLMLMAQGLWRDERGVNLLDGGVPWYDVYETADDQWLAVGALEPRFYAALLAGLGLTDPPDRADPQNWPALRALLDRPVRRADPGRVGRHLRRHRRLRRARPVPARGRRRPAPDSRARPTSPATASPSPPPRPASPAPPAGLSTPAPAPGQHTREPSPTGACPMPPDLVACGAAIQA